MNEELQKYIASLERVARPEFVTDAVPTYVPKNASESRVLYVNGSTYRIYQYFPGAGWHYVTYT